MIARVIKVLEISRGCQAFNGVGVGGGSGCGLTRNDGGMYIVRELLPSR